MDSRVSCVNRNIFKEHSIWVGLAAGAVIGLSLAQDAWAWATPWAVLAWAAAMSSARTQRVQAACLFTEIGRAHV